MTDKNTVYYYYMEGCGHCIAAKPVIERLKNELPKHGIRLIETEATTPNKLHNDIEGYPSLFMGNHKNTIHLIPEYYETVLKWILENKTDKPASVQTPKQTPKHTRRRKRFSFKNRTFRYRGRGRGRRPPFRHFRRFSRQNRL